MLRLSISTDEYVMIGPDVKISFIGGTKYQTYIMIDAPKDINIARGRAIAKRAKAKEKAQDKSKEKS